MDIETPSPRRGRPPKFDTDTVLDAAVGAFFVNGYEDTTLVELEAATGVDRSTLYNSFDGKRGIYLQAVDRYVDYAADNLFGPAADGDRGIDDVVELLRKIRQGLTSDDVSPGCLIVNDMAAGSAPAAATRYRDLLEGGVRAALNRAAASGEIAADTVESRTSLVSSAVIGVNLISRHTGDTHEVARLLDGTIAEVRSWATDPWPSVDQ